MCVRRGGFEYITAECFVEVNFFFGLVSYHTERCATKGYDGQLRRDISLSIYVGLFVSSALQHFNQNRGEGGGCIIKFEYKSNIK